MANFLTVGNIVNTQGLKGELRVMSQTDFPEERFKVGAKLFIETKTEKIPVTIKTHRLHKNFQLVSFVDYPSINDVEKYKGTRLVVDASELSDDDLAEDEFYYHEIIGLEVIDENGQNLGKVSEILETGANDVWTVKKPGRKDWYLPYIDQVVKEIDLDHGVVKIEMMEGLIDED
ncbi:ribosome maturation factor RimM [Enterococcus timonensis]|uniref:ribosome maturation factor RimM n=1 Tax=Enterococcus timonensis TaxID=1852364 RepID=UPI0008DAFD42|nr:ribosome maturation factor RimM [Enterococcus timonensis]